MRRKRQRLPEAEIQRILKNEEYGILSLNGMDGYPYAIPLNYLYLDSKIYFHCSKSGYKTDLIQKNTKCCFTVVGTHQVIAEDLTTAYASVIVTGTIGKADPEVSKQIIRKLALKFAPELSEERIAQEISQSENRFMVLELVPEWLEGKQGLAFMRQNQSG